MAAVEVIGVQQLYAKLKERVQHKYSPIDLMVRLRDGLKSPHSRIVMCLFWWHIFLTDRPLYARLKAVTDEPTMRQVLGGKAMTAYVQGEKTVAVCSDLFPNEFLEIIDAYIDYTDENAAASAS